MGASDLDLSYIFSAGIFVQLALLFYVLGVLARDELMLRGLLLLGSGSYIIYYYFIADTPLWDAIWASVVIGAANFFMICVILRERSVVGMSSEMLSLYKAFPTLNPGQFRKVMKYANWVTARGETQICIQGHRPDHLYLVSSGFMLLHRDGKDAQIGVGNFIGEISFLIDGPATADVIAPSGTEYVCWERTKLQSLMAKSPGISNAISALFNKDIARKLAVSTPLA